ncbi:cystatin-like [Kryptolebias marmoratus]|uniref:Cystatin-like n=1 Tax=Kryptolebias marmoratus TaxID=37003 RepID=A0A3Q3G704_KRYMA|nr:cystatin-like [Kryptolebias marmoratus]
MMWKVILPLLAAAFAVGSGSVLVGGPQNIDSNDAEFQKAMRFAVSQYNLLSDHIYYYKDTAVLSAQSQVVEGIKYTMTLKLEKTSCKKTEPRPDCHVIKDPAAAHSVICKFAVWVRIWLIDIRLMGSSCY